MIIIYIQVGYRSSLKSSQSISDLSSHIQAKHHRSRLTGNRFGQKNQFSKPTNPCKPMLNPKSTFKSQQLTNKVQGMGNALKTKLEIPNENCLSKNQTILCIDEKTKPNNNRPLTLTLKKTEKYKLSLNKANQSLPESPVCEELKLLKEQCKKSNATRFARFAQKRRSCSYFIGLDEDMENIAKSVESLPAMNNIENLKETMDEAEENGNFSDDSLEGDFKNPPRRCVSDYQINVHMDDHRNYTNYQNFQKKTLTGSQESILSDASIESFSKESADIDYIHYDHDRHSSASFFLSRRKMQAGRSQESILTDESDYQIFPLRENTTHQSTESVLTDDSDSLVKSAPLEMLFDSHYKRKRQNSETYSENPNNAIRDTAVDNTQDSVNENTICRTVFRSKSLQDTRINQTKNDINFMENNASPETRIYYEFNFDNEHKKNVDPIIYDKSETISRSNSLKVPMKPESMMILNNFVPHKPPKPKRNVSRTQSMRNRIKPSWKYIDTPPLSSAVKSTADSDNYIALSMNSSCSEYRVTRNDSEIKRDPISTETMEQVLQSANYPQESDNDKDSRHKFYSLQTHCTDNNVVLQDRLLCDTTDSPHLIKNRYLGKIHHTIEKQSVSSDRKRNCFENEIPTKDTETYDSLEPSGSSCDLQTMEPQSDGSNLQSANKRIDNLDANMDIRITRAIEGTVKLLSKEFENLVRQKQYFMKEKCLRLARYQDRERSENFAKLQAERENKFCVKKRDVQLHSCGEDCDCVDTSAMDRSLMESGSSTSASSCTNSPKRMWPPASRCQSYMKWTKTLPTINQAILPTKHSYAGIEQIENACVYFYMLLKLL